MKNWMTKNSIILFSILFLLTSCENFLKGAETRKQLEEYTHYVNAESFTIKVIFENNTGNVRTPAGAETKKKATDTFTIAFDPYADYCFINWKIIDAVTGKEYPNGEYLKIEALDKSETSCTLVKEPKDGMQLALFPVTSLRPSAFSWYPTAMNALKDTTIQVVFDRNIDQYSIYFTKEEIKELENDSSVTQLLSVTGQTFEDGTAKIYGYIKNSQKYYKNIYITKNTASGENLLNYFGAPVLDGETLQIPIDRKVNLVADYTKICVCLTDGFFSTEYNEKLGMQKVIKMSKNKIWRYQVSNHGDTTPLTISNITVTRYGKNQTGYSWDEHKTVLQNLTSLKTSYSNTLFNDFNNNNQYRINVSLNEDDLDGSGPTDDFKFYYKKVLDSSYNTIPINKQSTVPIPISYSTVSPLTASYNNSINLTTESLTEGVYEAWFEFSDKCGNIRYYPEDTDKKLYFVKDITGPDETKITKIRKVDNNRSIQITTTLSSAKDCISYQGRYRQSGTSNWTNFDYYTGSMTGNGGNVENGATVGGNWTGKFDVSIVCTDFFGNKGYSNTATFDIDSTSGTSVSY